MTTDITPGTTLRHIAVEHPRLIPCLESHALDYCCRGRDTVSEAAARIGLSASDLIELLNAYRADTGSRAPERDWSGASMTELADHIEGTHHAFAREALDRLGRLVGACVAAHAEDEPRLVELQRTLAALTEDMLDHLVREERVLFPWLRRLERRSEIQGGPPWSVRRPIDCMVHDHDDVGEAFRRIRGLTDDLRAPEGACATWIECYRLLSELERDTHLHIHKENNILFPAGVEAERRRRAGAVARDGAPSAREGFTLVELLVCLAIIATLIAVMLPALGRARSASRSVVCLAKSRSIATAMTMYAGDDGREFFPTARMPGMAMGGKPAAPFRESWICLLAPYVGVDATLPEHPTPEEISDFVRAVEVCRCPEDHSQNWEAMMMPRLSSYGINAYLTPNHPPHWGIRASAIASPARCVLSAELAEEIGMDHFMPMYWGDPPAVSAPMAQARQWDVAARLPRVIQHTRHGGERANYVFADGHAGTHVFSETWAQDVGEAPARDWYDPLTH